MAGTEDVIESGREARSPWDRNSAIVNQVLMGIPVVIGATAIARYRPRKLAYYLPGVVLLVTAWRRYVCARCQYYGKECSTLLGIATARMMPRDVEKPLDRNTMVADFAFIGVLALVPLPQVRKRRRLAVLYLLSLAAFFFAILFNACGRCGNEFCPMKDLESRLSGFRCIVMRRFPVNVNNLCRGVCMLVECKNT
jgi:hypothetical protein